MNLSFDINASSVSNAIHEQQKHDVDFFEHLYIFAHSVKLQLDFKKLFFLTTAHTFCQTLPETYLSHSGGACEWVAR